MNVSNYNLIHSASLLFCNTFLSIYLLSHTLFWKINKTKTELENTNQSQNSTHAMYTLSRQKKEKWKMKYDNLKLQLTTRPKLTLMSQYQPIFWVSEIKEPINFLLLVLQLLQLRKQSFAKQTNKQGFLYHLYLLLFIMIGSKYNIFDMFVCKVY